MNQAELDSYVLVFTGAGVSKDSGIPTFEETANIREYLTRKFATNHPKEYAEVLKNFKAGLVDKEPNTAHYAIASLGCTVLTMNVDQLHQKAGSTNVIEMHGSFNKGLVLYGDQAPEYKTAFKKISELYYGKSYLIVVGTSLYTGVSRDIIDQANRKRATIISINSNASIEVPIVIQKLKTELGLI